LDDRPISRSTASFPHRSIAGALALQVASGAAKRSSCLIGDEIDDAHRPKEGQDLHDRGGDDMTEPNIVTTAASPADAPKRR